MFYVHHMVSYDQSTGHSISNNSTDGRCLVCTPFCTPFQHLAIPQLHLDRNVLLLFALFRFHVILPKIPCKILLSA